MGLEAAKTAKHLCLNPNTNPIPNINININPNINTNSPRKAGGGRYFLRRLSDLDWRFFLLLFSSISLLLFFSLSLSSSSAAALLRRTAAAPTRPELTRSRMAVCLVGGARRFELTGPSIVDRVLNRYSDADVFVNSPLDSNSYKLGMLRFAHRVAAVRIFRPSRIEETEEQRRVLTAANSPNGIQGLLQYFNLVEGCLTMIQSYQKEKGFTYDWIIRTRVDGYWAAPLDPGSFIPGVYVVPPGSSFGGLNDRLGVGDYNTSVVALSRLSLVPTLDSLGYMGLNSETAFRAQLTAQNTSFQSVPQPFCIVTDRKYKFPPGRFDVPVAALSSIGPLSGAKCRPCTPACTGSCVGEVMPGLRKGWNWMPWSNRTVELCNAEGDWEDGWEGVFDRAAGDRLARFRKMVGEMDVNQCVEDFKELRLKSAHWETPPLEDICRLGLDANYSKQS